MEHNQLTVTSSHISPPLPATKQFLLVGIDENNNFYQYICLHFLSKN